jgi:glycosyltransferase involved in cell wall biosynthesis
MAPDRMLRLTVVTPSFNQGRFIERTLQSVLDQGYPCLEYIVCDGASTDETSQVLARYADRVRIIREPDRGQASAVNKGIRLTSGEIIGWLNSDDVYRPGALQTVADFFERNPSVDVVYGDADYIDADDAIIGRYYTEPWNPRRLVRRPFLCQPAVFFRRCLVDRFGGLDEQLHYTLDYEYWLRLAAGGATFAYLPTALAASRLHAETKTLSQGLKLHDELNVMLKRYVARVPDAWLLAQTHAILRAESGRRYASPLDFALAVACVSWRLSHEVNGRVSPALVLSTVRTLLAGALKTLGGRPVQAPVT